MIGMKSRAELGIGQFHEHSVYYQPYPVSQHRLSYYGPPMSERACLDHGHLDVGPKRQRMTGILSVHDTFVAGSPTKYSQKAPRQIFPIQNDRVLSGPLFP